MIFFPSRMVPLRWSNLWRCLADDAHSISVATAMLLTSTHLYLTGMYDVACCVHHTMLWSSPPEAFNMQLVGQSATAFDHYLPETCRDERCYAFCDLLCMWSYTLSWSISDVRVRCAWEVPF
jgi:hypothetical protein